MAKKKANKSAKDGSKAAGTARPLRGAGLLLLAVLLLAGFFAGLYAIDQWAREDVRNDSRYLIEIADIESGAPIGSTRAEFLDEVRYHSQAPGKLSVIDPEFDALVRSAFAKHPSVLRVDEVVRTPPKKVEVKLTFRQPVLAVRWEGGLRAVDGDAVLLPKSAPTDNLPVYSGEPLPPVGPAGRPWGDPKVAAEARKLSQKKGP